MSIVETLGKAGIIPVIVIEKEEQAVPLAKALVKGGLPVLEDALAAGDWSAIEHLASDAAALVRRLRNCQ